MSLYRGIVTDNTDPEGLMRLRARVPQIFGPAETDWMWPSIPIALGVQAPPVGSPIWVMFEADDQSRPVWVGVWRTSKQGGLDPDFSFGGVVGETTYGLAPDNGSASTVSRSDHTHGSPSLASTAPTVIQPNDAAAVGAGTTPSRSNHKHAIATAAPTASAPSDAVAEGTSTSFSRADHVHGREAPAAAADQTMQWMIVNP